MKTHSTTSLTWPWCWSGCLRVTGYSLIDTLQPEVSRSDASALFVTTESTLERGWPRPLPALSEPHPEEKVPEKWPAIVGESFGRCVIECLSFLPLPRLLSTLPPPPLLLLRYDMFSGEPAHLSSFFSIVRLLSVNNPLSALPPHSFL